METYTTLVKGETICIRNKNNEPFEGADGSRYEIHVQRYDDGSFSITTLDIDTEEVDSLKESDIRNYMVEVRKIMAEWDEEGN
jgi:hypothetical protein